MKGWKSRIVQCKVLLVTVLYRRSEWNMRNSCPTLLSHKQNSTKISRENACKKTNGMIKQRVGPKYHSLRRSEIVCGVWRPWFGESDNGNFADRNFSAHYVELRWSKPCTVFWILYFASYLFLSGIFTHNEKGSRQRGVKEVRLWSLKSAFEFISRL